MEEYSQHQWRQWRSKAVNIYYGFSFYAGLLYTGYMATEFLYIQDISHHHNSPFFFSVVIGTSRAAAAVAMLVGSTYHQFTLDIKRVILVLLGMALVGNILYLIPYSMGPVLLATCLIMTSSILVPIITSEITIIVDHEDVANTVSLAGSFYTLGMIVGPCLAFAFNRFDFQKGDYRLYYGNVPAIFLGGLHIPLFLSVYFLRNLAKMHQNKMGISTQFTRPRTLREQGRMIKIQINDEDIFPSSEESETDDDDEERQLIQKDKTTKSHLPLSTYFLTAWSILSDKHFGVNLLASAVALYSLTVMMYLLVVTSVQRLQWSVPMLATIRIVALVGGLISASIAVELKKHVKDFILNFIVIATSIIPVIMISVTPSVGNTDVLKGLILSASFVTGFIEAMVHINAATILSRLVRTEYHQVSVTVRHTVFQLALAVAGFSIGVVYEYLTIGGFMIVFVIICSTIALLTELKSSMDSEGTKEWDE